MRYMQLPGRQEQTPRPHLPNYNASSVNGRRDDQQLPAFPEGQPKTQSQSQSPQEQRQPHSAVLLPLETAEKLARRLYKDKIRIDTALSKRIAQRPAARMPTQRRGSQSLNLKRRSNVEALLCHITGQESRRPCGSCRKGHGPSTKCVILQGAMCGSCTNCWFNASGARCSYHGKNKPSRSHPHAYPCSRPRPHPPTCSSFTTLLSRPMLTVNAAENNAPVMSSSLSRAAGVFRRSSSRASDREVYSGPQQPLPQVQMPRPHHRALPQTAAAATSFVGQASGPTLFESALGDVPSLDSRGSSVAPAAVQAAVNLGISQGSGGDVDSAVADRSFASAMGLDHRGRLLARIQAAALELGLRMSEYKEWERSLPRCRCRPRAQCPAAAAAGGRGGGGWARAAPDFWLSEAEPGLLIGRRICTTHPCK